MKRFQFSVSVKDINASVRFYRTLFGVGPTVLKDDYAKWMLEDPRINFSISQSRKVSGVSHIGLQADSMQEFEIIQSRLEDAQANTVDQSDAACCYTRSSRTWVRDPGGVARETFVTHAQMTHYGDDRAAAESSGSHCCA